MTDVWRLERNLSLRIFLGKISGQKNKGKSRKVILLVLHENSEALGDGEGISDAFILDSFIFKLCD